MDAGARSGVPSVFPRPVGVTERQRTYMYELAGTPAKSRRRAPQKVKPYLQRVLDRIDAPAIVMTPTHDILAWNPIAAALMVDFGEIPERERNFTAEPGSRSEQALRELAAWAHEHLRTTR